MKLFTSQGLNSYVIMHTVLFAFSYPERACTSNCKTQVTTGKHDNKAQQISGDVNSRTHGSPKIFKKCPHIQTCLSIITPESASGNDHSLLFKSPHCNRSYLCLLCPSPTSRGNRCVRAVKVRNLLVWVPGLRGLAPITCPL